MINKKLISNRDLMQAVKPCPIPSDPQQRLDITCSHCGRPIDFRKGEVFKNGQSYVCQPHSALIFARSSATGYVCEPCHKGDCIVFRGIRAKCSVCGKKRICVWTKLPNAVGRPRRGYKTRPDSKQSASHENLKVNRKK